MKPQDLLKYRALCFHGEESGLSREWLDGVLEAAGLVKDDFDLEIRNGDEGSPGDWFASVTTSPFLAERRVLVIRQANRWDPAKSPIPDLKGLPAASLLIFVGDEEATSDPSRQTKFASNGKAIATLVEKAGGKAVESKPDPAAAKNRLKTAIADDGRKITEGALESLLEMCGGRYSRAKEELDKLTLYAGSAVIREADVEAIVVPSRDFQIFKLVDAIVANRVPDALKQLKAIVTSAKKPEEEAFRTIFPMVSRNLRLLWQARLCVDAGCAPQDPTPAVLARLPEKPDIRRESPYRSNSLVRTARGVPLARLARCLTIVADADARLKGQLDSYATMDSLERMVLEMAQAIHAPSRA